MRSMQRSLCALWRSVGVRRALTISVAALLLTSCAEMNYLRNKVLIQDQRIRELQSSLREWQDAYDKLYNQKLTENEDFNKQLKLRNSDIQRLRTMRSDKERELEVRMNELKIRLQKTLDTNAALDLEMRKESESAQARIASQKKQIATLEATGSRLEKDLATARSAAGALRGRAEAADRTLRTAEQRVKALESELEDIKTALDERNRTINEQEQTIAGLRKTVKTSSEGESKLSRQLADLKKQLADERRIGEAERKKQRAEIGRLTSNLAALRSEPGAQDPNLAKAKKELTEILRDEIKQKTAEVVGSFDRVIVRFQSDVLFERTTVLLRPSVQPRLHQVAEVLGKYPGYQLRIEGHTDNTPVRNMPFPDNLALSSQRADNVLRFLREATKLPQKQVRSTGCSYWLPLASNDTLEGRRRNRRVEVILTHEE